MAYYQELVNLIVDCSMKEAISVNNDAVEWLQPTVASWFSLLSGDSIGKLYLGLGTLWVWKVNMTILQFSLSSQIQYSDKA